MTSFPPPSPPYVGPAAHIMHDAAGHPLPNKPINRLVVHSTVSPCVPGGARKIAAYFKTEAAGGSAHYVTDPSESVQVVYDSLVAEHAPPNPGSLGFEMTDIPGPVPNDSPGSARWKALKRAWRWALPNQRKMLRRTARLVAEAALANDIPLRFLSVADLRAHKRGITTHANVSKAFFQSTHWDPGFWPRRRFMQLVRAEAAAIRKAHR